MSPASSPHEAVRARIDRLGQVTQLDTIADKLDGVLRPRLEPTPVRNALSGVWLGHRLHPMLTDVAISCFSGAALVDLVAPRHPRIARRLIGLGLLAAIPTAASGFSDWIDVYDDGRRIGLVHAAGNSVALILYTRSFLRRGRLFSKRGRGRLSSFAGLAVLAVTGYLGGHLSYVLGVGVDHTAFEPRLEDWVDVGAADELADGDHMVAKAGELEILLVRTNGTVRALDNRCSHAGWPLAPGTFADGCVTCPQHGSVFRLDDGTVERGPAASPQRIYEVRERDGRLEVRSRK